MSDGKSFKKESNLFTSIRNSLRRKINKSVPTKTKSQLNIVKKKLGLSKYRNQVQPIPEYSPFLMASNSTEDETTQEGFDVETKIPTPPENEVASIEDQIDEIEDEVAPIEQEPAGAQRNVYDSTDQSSSTKSGDTTETLQMEDPLDPKATMDRLAELRHMVKPMPSDQSADHQAQQGLALEKREHLYKILVIGELGAGKTSIIKRYVHQFFSQHYRATIGVDFALKVLNWDSSTVIRLQLWDIAGQERFGNMTRVYYKEAVGAFVVFDVTRVATFDAVLKWKQDLDSKVQLPDGSPIPCVLLANKCDQQKEGLVNSPSKMDDYCKERGFSGWFETSAKENVNIEEAARFLVNKILQNDQMLQAANNDQRDGDKFSLDGSKRGGNNSGGRESSGGGKSVCSC